VDIQLNFYPDSVDMKGRAPARDGRQKTGAARMPQARHRPMTRLGCACR